MSFSGSRGRLVDAVFARLGEDALWGDDDVLVRVRLAERDDVTEFDRASQIVTARFLRVRASEVASPVRGEVVTMLDSDGQPDGRSYQLIAPPRQTRNRVWLCEIDEVA